MFSIVAKEIKETRKAKGLTQQELADTAGIAVTSIRRYEAGERTPIIVQLEKIAAALGMDFAILLGKARLLEGAYLSEEAPPPPPKPTSASIGTAYEKATPSVKKTVEVALEPFMDKGINRMSRIFTVAIQKDDDWFVAKCLENSVASQGKTIDEAMGNLREALTLYYEDETLPMFPQTYVTTLEVAL